MAILVDPFALAINRRYTRQHLAHLNRLYAAKRRIERAILRAPMLPPKRPLMLLVANEKAIAG